MSEFDKTQDRIDEYIRGTMSTGDRSIFEDELCNDDALRHEVQVETAIAEAVQSVHLKHLFQGLEEERGLIRRRVLVWGSIAAALATLIFAGYSARQSHRIKEYGSEYYALLIVPSNSEGDSIDSLFFSSHALIEKGDFDSAVIGLNEARGLIAERRSQLSLPIQSMADRRSNVEEALIRLSAKQYDVDWYEAVILMKVGRFHKAKKALRSIAASKSPYADNAKEVLYNMFKIKL